MPQEIVLDANGSLLTLALLAEGKPQEILVLPEETPLCTGNLYWGRVQRGLPGMQAAFVDIGLEKNAFLPLTSEERSLRQGESLLVQAQKQPGGDKGLRVTRTISLAGRLAVLLPQGGVGGISAKITDAAERERLKNLIQELRPEGSAVLLRTAAQGAAQAALAEDMGALQAEWQAIQSRCTGAPKLVYQPPHAAERFVRDLLGQVQRVVVGDQAWYERLRQALLLWAPENPPALELYPGTQPLLDVYQIQTKLDKALRRQVWLKSGGSLVFDACEALTVIDVNTAKCTGNTSLEETLLGINLEAAGEIAAQLRLRDIGGIVVVDFIDLAAPEHRAQLIEAFRKALSSDRAPIDCGNISAFGLVELTRKRLYTGLCATLRQPCPYCRGEGRVLQPEAVARTVLLQLQRRAASGEAPRWLVRAQTPVIETLQRWGVTPGWQVYGVGTPSQHCEKFAITGLGGKEEPAEGALLPENITID